MPRARAIFEWIEGGTSRVLASTREVPTAARRGSAHTISRDDRHTENAG